MHFYILGGSGRTGKLLIEEALTRGHTVTALTRDQSKIIAKDGLTVCTGTPYNKSDIDASFLHGGTPDAVLVTLSGQATGNPFAARGSPDDTLRTSNANVVAAMKAYGIKKIVIMHAMGVGDSFENLNFLMRAIVKWSPMGVQFRDHDATDKMIREEGKDGSLQWVMVRPPMLKGEEKLPIKELGDQGNGAGFMPSCSRGSVARFMVEAAENATWDEHTPVIVN